jgi:flagellar motor switch/type III secretory pathway protein FliN
MPETTSSAALAAPEISPALWEEAGWLGCELSVELPLYGFTVGNLLQLSVGSIVETHWRNGDDIPLHVNRRQIAWIEFEALGDSLGFRVTELL